MTGDLPILQHHLIHAAIIAAGAALAMVTTRKAANTTEHPLWLIPAISALVLLMLLMLPSVYATLDHNGLLHMADHLALLCAGFLAVFAGQRYRAGTGWALGALAVLMALSAAGGFGAYA